MKNIAVVIVLALLMIGHAYSQTSKNVKTKNMNKTEQADH